MKEIYHKIKEINQLLRESSINFEEKFPYQELMRKSSEILTCSIFIVNTNQNFLGYAHSKKLYQEDATLQNFFQYQKFPEEIATKILNDYERIENVPITQSLLSSVKELSLKFSNDILSFFPIEKNHLSLGTLFILSDRPLSEEEVILVDLLATFIGNEMAYLIREDLEKERRNESFLSLIQSLSRSELEDFKNIIEKIKS